MYIKEQVFDDYGNDDIEFINSNDKYDNARCYDIVDYDNEYEDYNSSSKDGDNYYNSNTNYDNDNSIYAIVVRIAMATIMIT